MVISDQILETVKDIQSGECSRYSTVWNNHRVIIQPIKHLNLINVSIDKYTVLEYTFQEDTSIIVTDIIRRIEK